MDTLLDGGEWSKRHGVGQTEDQQADEGLFGRGESELDARFWRAVASWRQEERALKLAP
jgi:hypothetical protein